MVYWDVMDSPLGAIHLAATDEGLVYCASAREKGDDMFLWLEKYLPQEKRLQGQNAVLEEAVFQLQKYFSGESQKLDVPLKLIGTEFRQRVWEALQTIPYGQTRTYGEVARKIGRPQGPRAVGQANHHNPISYFVP